MEILLFLQKTFVQFIMENSEVRPFTVVESFLKGKKDETSNEDGLCLTSWYAAVVDGATPKTAFRPEGRTPGRMAMELVSEAIRLLPHDADAYTALDTITAHIARFCERHGWLEDMQLHPERRLTASAAIFSRFRQEIWLVGDCKCLIDGQAHGYEKTADRVLAATRALMLELELLDGKTTNELQQHDTGREFILPALRRQTMLQNLPDTPQAYAVFDGLPVLRDRVAILPTDKATHVVLGSDGYPQLMPTLAESENYLQEILEEDPLCFRKFQSTKGVLPGNSSFDDRAYLRLCLG